MLVAPLMTPIFSLSVALIRGRTLLLETSVRTEAIGVGLAVLIAVVIGLLVPEPELTPEILARVRPSLFDLAVALAAGLAGAFALVREEISPALPGVAIAVALLPPLAVIGLGLSMRRLDVAGGARPAGQNGEGSATLVRHRPLPARKLQRGGDRGNAGTV